MPIIKLLLQGIYILNFEILKLFYCRDRTYEAVQLGQYDNADDLNSAINKLSFLGGGRHHDEAFIQALPILTQNVRPGVARFNFFSL